MPSEKTLGTESIMVGIGGVAATRTPGSVVKTLALGSCVAVIFLDPPTRLVGLVHVALPESAISPEKARELPGYFADTGIPILYKKFLELGYRESGRSLLVKLAGGSQIMDRNETFNIGKRNALAAKKILWSMKLGAVAEDLGGEISRSVRLDVDAGTVLLSTPGLPDKFL